jgi:hypothetical protein
VRVDDPVRKDELPTDSAIRRQASGIRAWARPECFPDA